MSIADAILMLTSSRRTFFCPFSAKRILLVVETLHFAGYVICSAYLRCFERETVCKGISTQNIVPVVYQDRGRGKGKAIYSVA